MSTELEIQQLVETATKSVHAFYANLKTLQ